MFQERQSIFIKNITILLLKKLDLILLTARKIFGIILKQEDKEAKNITTGEFMKYLKFFQYTLLSASIFTMGITPSTAMDDDLPPQFRNPSHRHAIPSNEVDSKEESSEDENEPKKKKKPLITTKEIVLVGSGAILGVSGKVGYDYIKKPKATPKKKDKDEEAEDEAYKKSKKNALKRLDSLENILIDISNIKGTDEEDLKKIAEKEKRITQKRKEIDFQIGYISKKRQIKITKSKKLYRRNKRA